MNIQLSELIVKSLVEGGVSEFVVCAGARNAPLIKVLNSISGIRVYNFFEERSAGFFALGCIKRTGRPVAVVTTSGTAAAELLPAIIEGHHSSLALVAVTADRPMRFRTSGAPQAIDQVGLYSHFVGRSWDFQSSVDFELDLDYSPKNTPLHINVSFEEPLLDQDVSIRNLKIGEIQKRSKGFSPDEKSFVDKFWKIVEHPLVIVGALSSSLIESVTEELLRLGAPVYLETSSRLLGESKLNRLRIRGGEMVLSHWIDRGWADGVLRIGSVPTAKIWRLLDTVRCDIPVLSASESIFSGLAREKNPAVNIEAYLMYASGPGRKDCHQIPSEVSQWGLERESRLLSLIEQLPLSEPSWFLRLQQQTSLNSLLFLGNSMPIRYWDLVGGTHEKHSNEVYSSRGANGIDGQMSTFLGCTKEGVENVCVLGDLTTLYDLSAPWVVRQLSQRSIHIFVINNGGGQIFKQIFDDKNFENSHNLKFENWAKMFDAKYFKWQELSDVSHLPKNSLNIIEVVPNNAQTEKFWSLYKEGLL